MQAEDTKGNMDMKSDDSNKKGLAKLFKISFYGIPMPIYLVGLAIIILGLATKSLPADITGSLFLVFGSGLIFGKIGDNLPIWKDYLGGGAILAFF